jgi:general secretion pathway protein C
MDKFFRTYFLWFQGAFFVLIGVMLAAAINSVVGSFLVPFTVVVPDAPTGSGESESGEVVSYGLPPDLFGREEAAAEPADPCAEVTCEEGQVCNPLTGACELAVAPEPEGPEVPTGLCVESDMAIALAGTMVSTDPAWSIAVLHNPATNQTEFAAIGDTILAEATVNSIERNRVLITRNGREECLRTGDRAARQAAAGAAGMGSPGGSLGGLGTQPGIPELAVGGAEGAQQGTPPAVPTGPRSIEDRIRTDITRGEDGSYGIPRDLLQEVASNDSLMRRQAPEISPYYENGQPRGLQLRNLRSDSIFSQIGIRNGDVLVAANGSPITSPQQAASMYDSMMSQSSVSLTVLRRGRERTIQYNVR